jgi:hypothetical protein
MEIGCQGQNSAFNELRYLLDVQKWLRDEKLSEYSWGNDVILMITTEMDKDN